MLMTTGKLILLRLFNVTIGQLGVFSRALRMALEKTMITGKRKKYVASSEFFDMKDLKQGPDEDKT